MIVGSCLPVPGTTSILSHSKIPKGIVGNSKSLMQKQKRMDECENIEEGSSNADPCGEVVVYVCMYVCTTI